MRILEYEMREGEEEEKKKRKRIWRRVNNNRLN
jgi:hypothetical protein